MRVGGQPHAQAVSTPGKDTLHTVQEAGWAPGLVWTVGKSGPTAELQIANVAYFQSNIQLSGFSAFPNGS